MKRSGLFESIFIVSLALLTPAQAQQITGTPGSPEATTTIDGRYIIGGIVGYGRGGITMKARDVNRMMASIHLGRPKTLQARAERNDAFRSAIESAWAEPEPTDAAKTTQRICLVIFVVVICIPCCPRID